MSSTYDSRRYRRSEDYRLTVDSKGDPLVEAVRREVGERNRLLREAR